MGTHESSQRPDASGAARPASTRGDFVAPRFLAVRAFPARLLILFVTLYQGTLSPYIGRQCRYQPTCSAYCIEAVRKYGAIKGGAMGLWRICRCHPFAKGGYDPVR